jgi:hypothetical protein
LNAARIVAFVPGIPRGRRCAAKVLLRQHQPNLVDCEHRLCARFIAAPCGSAFDFSNPFKNTETSATIASDRLAFRRSKSTISSRMFAVTSEEFNLAYPSMAHHPQTSCKWRFYISATHASERHTFGLYT